MIDVEAGMSASSTVLCVDSGGRTKGATSTLRDEESGAQDVNKHGGAQFLIASVSVKTPKYSGGAPRHERVSKAPRPPEADEGKRMEPVVVVGRTCVGDFCHVPVTVGGVPCSALVETQSEPTTVQIRTVTGELAPMKGNNISQNSQRPMHGLTWRQRPSSTP
ncbi:uncharacterized protein ACWYII_044209 [Salvelinus alpinus]